MSGELEPRNNNNLPAENLTSDERMALAWEMFNNLVPKAEIARRLRCSRNTVYADLKRAAALDAKEFDPSLARSSVLQQLDNVKRWAKDKLDKASPDSNPGPGYLRTIIDSIKEQNKLLDVYPTPDEQNQGLVLNIVQRGAQNTVSV